MAFTTDFIERTRAAPDPRDVLKRDARALKRDAQALKRDAQAENRARAAARAGAQAALATARRARRASAKAAGGHAGRVLLLQGPVGPFFHTFRRTLAARDVETRQIAFNTADLAFGDPFTTDVFRGRERAWRAHLRSVLDAWTPDVVVMFGCERVRHAVARRMCGARGIAVLSLEEGYVRPGYVTAEWGGNNRCSPLAHAAPERIAALARQPKPEAAAPSSFGRMAWFSFLYYVMRSAGRPIMRHSIHHKRRPLPSETGFWLRSAWRKVTRARRNRRTIDWLLEHQRDNFVVVPLQVRDDMQLEKAGRGWTNMRVIEAVTASFAAHAPTSRYLVFKVHPLERGHCNAIERVADVAARHGVADRVMAIDDGSIGLVTSAAAGMVTVNSTSAFSALLRGVPLAVLGDAMFRRPELAWCVETPADLDRFWREGRAAETEAAGLFREAMMRSALVPGDFYLPRGRNVAAANLAEIVCERIAQDRARNGDGDHTREREPQVGAPVARRAA